MHNNSMKLFWIVVCILFCILVENVAEASEIYSHGPEEPVGVLSDSERSSLNKGLFCTSCQQDRHFSLVPHRHIVTEILYTTDFMEARGCVASCGRSNTDTTLGYSETLYRNNSWSATISFAADVVSAAVGYSVEAGENRTAYYEIEVPAGKCGEIYLYDMFKLTHYNCKTVYYQSSDPWITSEEYGTGEAKQFDHFVYGSIIS